MRRMFTVLAAVALVSPAWAGDAVVGSGVVVTETREVPEFDQIELRLGGNVHVAIGKPKPLEIEGDDNVLPLIKTEVRKRRLVIWADSDFRSKRAPVISITVADIEAAAISGSGDMHVQGLDNKKLALNVAGSGDLRAAGKTDRLVVNIAGSGDVAAFELDAQDASVNIAGSGDAEVSAAESLQGMIHGSGDVHYAGDPQVHTVIAGSGDVKARK